MTFNYIEFQKNQVDVHKDENRSVAVGLWKDLLTNQPNPFVEDPAGNLEVLPMKNLVVEGEEVTGVENTT